MNSTTVVNQQYKTWHWARTVLAVGSLAILAWPADARATVFAICFWTIPPSLETNTAQVDWVDVDQPLVTIRLGERIAVSNLRVTAVGALSGEPTVFVASGLRLKIDHAGVRPSYANGEINFRTVERQLNSAVKCRIF